MPTEDLVRAILEENFELNVEKIPETDEQTPDFFAYNDAEKFLVEVKEKQHPGHEAGQEQSFLNDEFFHIAESIQPRAVLETIVRNGRRQIAAYAEHENTFRIIWVHCTGLAYDATRDQIVAGLYGSVTVVDWDDGGFRGPCYYFNESQFFRYRESIDGVAISCADETMKFCLNDHSPRYDALRESALANGFKEGVIDPPQEERDRNAFLVDAPIDRGKGDVVFQYLEEKYKTKMLRIVPMQYHEVQMQIPT